MTMPLHDVLELARWAPSGDNSQTWRFSIEAPDRVAVFGFDTRHHCVYDLDGHPSQLSVGALLETIALAATRFGLRADIARRESSTDERPIFDVRFAADASRGEDPLVAHIIARRVQRRALRTRPLTAAEKQSLEGSVAPRFSLRWFEGWSGRASVTRINFANAKIRLTIPEAFPVHRDIIEWDTELSEDRIPAPALGAGAPTLALMRWAMKSWRRIDTLNNYLGGTIAPRIELDLVPGLACAAHCAIIAREPPRTIDDYVAAGRAMQRFWLTVASLSLQFQPGYTPLVFARYAREGVRFSTREAALRQAAAMRGSLDRLLGRDASERAVFMGRVGAGDPAASRSVRLPLERLMQPLPAAGS